LSVTSGRIENAETAIAENPSIALHIKFDPATNEIGDRYAVPGDWTFDARQHEERRQEFHVYRCLSKSFSSAYTE